MNIAVLAANGKAGQKIVAEALKRGHDVTAVVRSANKSQATRVIYKDIMDLTSEDLEGFDVVVSAFGVFAPDLLPQYTTTLLHVGQVLAGTPTRFLVVGGAGSLYLDESMTAQLADAPDFPDIFKPVAAAMAQGLAALRAIPHLKWTFVSPAADFLPDGPARGYYHLAGEIFTTDEAGISQISYADYAVAMVDEIEQAQHIGQRISVRW